MRIELVTSGGFTGRGIGSVRVDGSNALIDGGIATELTPTELARLDRLPILRTLRAPLIRPDAIVFTLNVDGRRWTWGEHSAPPDFASWADALMAIRRRVLENGQPLQPPSSM